MPVIATPITSAAAPGSPDGALQYVLPALQTARAGVTTVFDNPVPGKARGVAVQAGQQVVLPFTLLDANANPADLTSLGLASGPGVNLQVVAYLREATGLDQAVTPLAGAVTDAANGVLAIPLNNSGVQANAGVYHVEAAVLDTTATSLLISNTFYLYVQRGLFAPPAGCGGPPTLQEVRLALRDQPEYNRLLDAYEHDVAEVAEAVLQAVQYWNSASPDLGFYYDTRSFPTVHRGNWLHGVCSHLYAVAAAWHRRSQLDYNAGGVQVNDLSKAQAYEQAAQLRGQLFRDWVKLHKARLNMEAGYGENPSAYANQAYGWW